MVVGHGHVLCRVAAQYWATGAHTNTGSCTHQSGGRAPRCSKAAAKSEDIDRQASTRHLSVYMRRGATFDASRRYRYTLWRTWDSSLPRVAFIMLNPNTTDHRKDDPTLRRCIGFERSWGFGSLLVVNLFAFRTPSPKMLARACAPVGPRNDHYLMYAARRANTIVLAWGTHGVLLDRHQYVLEMLSTKTRRRLSCLGVTTGGYPRHPLYLPATTRPSPWPHHD